MTALLYTQDLIFFYTGPHAHIFLTLLHSERPKLHRVLAVLSALGLKSNKLLCFLFSSGLAYVFLFFFWPGLCVSIFPLAWPMCFLFSSGLAYVFSFFLWPGLCVSIFLSGLAYVFFFSSGLAYVFLFFLWPGLCVFFFPLAWPMLELLQTSFLPVR